MKLDPETDKNIILFKQLLIEEGCFEEFKANFALACDKKQYEKITTTLKSNELLFERLRLGGNAVSWAFTWRKTKQGHEYWRHINRAVSEKFYKRIKELK